MIRVSWFLIVLIVVGCNKPAGNTASRPVAAIDPPVFTGKAVELWREFQANEAAATERYVGKPVELTGTGKVSKSGDDLHVFEMPSAADRAKLSDGQDIRLVCRIAPRHVNRFAEIPEDPKFHARLRGICKGVERNSDRPGLTIHIDSCELVRAESTFGITRGPAKAKGK